MKSKGKTVVLAMALLSSSLSIMAGEQTEQKQEPNKQALLDLQVNKIERKGAGVVVAEGHVVIKLEGWRIASEKVVLKEEPSRVALAILSQEQMERYTMWQEQKGVM